MSGFGYHSQLQRQRLREVSLTSAHRTPRSRDVAGESLGRNRKGIRSRAPCDRPAVRVGLNPGHRIDIAKDVPPDIVERHVAIRALRIEQLWILDSLHSRGGRRSRGLHLCLPVRSAPRDQSGRRDLEVGRRAQWSRPDRRQSRARRRCPTREPRSSARAQPRPTLGALTGSAIRSSP